MLKKALFLISICSVIFQATTAHANEVSIVRTSRARISGLRLKAIPTLVEEASGGKTQSYVIIEGLYPRADWSLIVGKTKLKRNEKGYFKAKTRILGREKPLALAAVGPGGQVELESLKILYPEYGTKRKGGSRHSFSVGTGISILGYTQEASPISDAVDLKEKGITLKGSYVYRLHPNWDLGITAFTTAAVLSTSEPSTTARFVGANFRVGYALPYMREPWRLLLMFGGYYTTMIVSPNTFGFRNLSGPQFFPVLRRALPKGDSISSYFKISPVSAGGFSITNLSSREMAFGVTYNMNLKNGHSVPFSLDYSNLKSSVATQDASYSIPVAVNSLTFGIGYNF